MTLIDQLSEKIDLTLQKIQSQQALIEEMQLKITALSVQNEEKDRQISTLYEEIAARDKGMRELCDKVGEAL